jgi:hypothetical protein
MVFDVPLFFQEYTNFSAAGHVPDILQDEVTRQLFVAEPDRMMAFIFEDENLIYYLKSLR